MSYQINYRVFKELPSKVINAFLDKNTGAQHVIVDVTTSPRVNPQRVIAGIVEETKRMQEEEKNNEQEENTPNENDKGKRYRKLLIIPIVLVLAGGGLLLANNKGDKDQLPPKDEEHDVEKSLLIHKEVQQVISYTIPINMEVYDVQNPSLDLAGSVGMVGQERMTNQYIFKEKSAYNQDSHADLEEKSVNDFELFENLKKQVDDNFVIIANPLSSKQDRLDALNMIISLQSQTDSLYSRNANLMGQMRRCFS